MFHLNSTTTFAGISHDVREVSEYTIFKEFTKFSTQDNRWSQYTITCGIQGFHWMHEIFHGYLCKFTWIHGEHSMEKFQMSHTYGRHHTLAYNYLITPPRYTKGHQFLEGFYKLTWLPRSKFIDFHERILVFPSTGAFHWPSWTNHIQYHANHHQPCIPTHHLQQATAQAKKNKTRLDNYRISIPWEDKQVMFCPCIWVNKLHSPPHPPPQQVKQLNIHLLTTLVYWECNVFMIYLNYSEVLLVRQ